MISPKIPKPTPVPRGQVEHARDMAMVQALFYWKYAERLKSKKLNAKGDECARAAMRLARELEGQEDPDESE